MIESLDARLRPVNSEEVDAKRVNKAIAYGCRLLSMREYSRQGIKQKMLAKGYFSLEVSQAVDFLCENNYLNDLRFCESFIRYRVQKGQGEARIRFELKSQGLSESYFNDFLNEVDWQSICDKTCLKKLATLDITKGYESRFKLQRFLNYRGFTSQQINCSVKQYFNNSETTSSEYDK